MPTQIKMINIKMLHWLIAVENVNIYPTVFAINIRLLKGIENIMR